MAKTQNGWSTIDSTQLDKSSIVGTDVVPVPGLRKGDVTTVLLEVGRLFNKNVAKLYNPGCWGWNAPIPIPGSNVISNHGSGTAVDFNAPSFPWQVRRMTAKQRAACRAIVNQMDGVVAWGGDFTTIVDEMHFEIVGSAAQVKALAKKIKEDDMSQFVTAGEAEIYYRHFYGTSVSEWGKKNVIGKMTRPELAKLLRTSATMADRKKKAAAGTLNVEGHLPSELRKVYEAPTVTAIGKSAVLAYITKNLK